MVLKLEMIKSL